QPHRAPSRHGQGDVVDGPKQFGLPEAPLDAEVLTDVLNLQHLPESPRPGDTPPVIRPLSPRAPEVWRRTNPFCTDSAPRKDKTSRPRKNEARYLQWPSVPGPAPGWTPRPLGTWCTGVWDRRAPPR